MVAGLSFGITSPLSRGSAAQADKTHSAFITDGVHGNTKPVANIARGNPTWFVVAVVFRYHGGIPFKCVHVSKIKAVLGEIGLALGLIPFIHSPIIVLMPGEMEKRP